MTDQNRQALESIGIDLNQTLARFVGNEGMLFRFLKRLPDDKTYDQLVAAVDKGDTEDGFHQAHTLKGVVGNLGLGQVFDAVTPLVESLRAGEIDKARQELPPVQEAYTRAMETIQNLDA